MAGEAYKSNMSENPLHPEPSSIKPSTAYISSLHSTYTHNLPSLLRCFILLISSSCFAISFFQSVEKLPHITKRWQLASVAVSVETIKYSHIYRICHEISGNRIYKISRKTPTERRNLTVQFGFFIFGFWKLISTCKRKPKATTVVTVVATTLY